MPKLAVALTQSDSVAASAMSSPGAGSSGDNLGAASSTLAVGNLARSKDVHPHAAKLPKPIKTGNKAQGTDDEGVHQQFVMLVDTCLKDRSHVVPLFSKLQARLNEKAAEAVGVGFEKFERQPVSIASLGLAEFQGWTTHYIETKTDLTAADIVKAMNFDDHSLLHILQGMTGIPQAARFPTCCRVKAVMVKVLDFYVAAFGFRMKTFKLDHGMSADGRLNFKKLRYRFERVEGLFTAVIHSLTGHKKDISGLKLSVDHDLTTP